MEAEEKSKHLILTRWRSRVKGAVLKRETSQRDRSSSLHIVAKTHNVWRRAGWGCQVMMSKTRGNIVLTNKTKFELHYLGSWENFSSFLKFETTFLENKHLFLDLWVWVNHYLHAYLEEDLSMRGTTLRVPRPALIVGGLQAKASKAPHCQPGACRSCCGEGRDWQCPWVPWGIIRVNIPGWRKCTAWEQAGSWAQFLWVERGPLNSAWRMPGWDRKIFLFLPLKYFSIFLLDLKTGKPHALHEALL